MITKMKKLFLAALALVASYSVALPDAALLPNAKQTFFDNSGKPLSFGKVFFYIPATSTPKTTWQNATQSTTNTNPVILDSAGRALIYGDGQYRQVLQTSAGVQIWDALTNSTGTGGTTPTTGDGVPVGMILPYSGLSAPANYVLSYGQAISRTTYSTALASMTITQSATCVASSTTLAVVDSSQMGVGMPLEASCVAPGTTIAAILGSTTIQLSAPAAGSGSVSAVVFPWGNGDGSTTFNVPDMRGRVLAGRDCEGGTAANRLTSTYYGVSACTIAAPGGSQSVTLSSAQMPAHTHVATVTDPGHTHTVASATTANAVGGGAPFSSAANTTPTTSSSVTGISVSNASTGGGLPHSVVQPTLTVNYIIKVTPDAGSGLSGTVTSVALSMPSIFSVAGSPITTTGTFVTTLVNQSANTLFAGPASGSATVPAFRALVPGDLSPAVPYVYAVAYGALCNSTGSGIGNDDTAAFRAAIAAVPSGGRVIAPSHGVCRFTDNLTVTDGVELSGNMPPTFTSIIGTLAGPIYTPTFANMTGTWFFADFTTATASELILLNGAGSGVRGIGFLERQPLPTFSGTWAPNTNNPTSIRAYRPPSSNDGTIAYYVRDSVPFGINNFIYSDGALGGFIDNIPGTVFGTFLRVEEQFQAMNVSNVNLSGYWYSAAGITTQRDTVFVSFAIGTPGVVTWATHGLAAGAPILFSGTLPPELSSGIIYFVKTVLSANTFTVSTISGGAAINFSTASSGNYGRTSFGTLILNYQYLNTIGIQFGRADTPFVTNFFMFGCNTVLKFVEGSTPGSSAGGSFTNIQGDSCTNAIHVQSNGGSFQMSGLRSQTIYPGAAVTYGIRTTTATANWRMDITNADLIGFSRTVYIEDDGVPGRGGALVNFNGGFWCDRYDAELVGRACITVPLIANSYVTVQGQQTYNPSSGNLTTSPPVLGVNIIQDGFVNNANTRTVSIQGVTYVTTDVVGTALAGTTNTTALSTATLNFRGSSSGNQFLAVPAVASGGITFPAGTTNFTATGGTSQVVKQTSVGAAFTVARLACSDLSDSTGSCSSAGAALTRTNDTNVTVTLGGTPTTALLQSVSLTLGWSGVLANARGGTGVANPAQILGGYANNVNLNSVADTTIAISLPSGVTKYRISNVIVYNKGTTASLTTAAAAIYSAAAAAGTAVVAPAALSSITSNTIDVATNYVILTPIIAAFDYTTLFFRVTTAQGAAATGDVYLYVQPMP